MTVIIMLVISATCLLVFDIGKKKEGYFYKITCIKSRLKNWCSIKKKSSESNPNVIGLMLYNMQIFKEMFKLNFILQ